MPGKRKVGAITEEVLCAEYESVYRYALALCRRESDAQDIVQETFLKAMRAYGDFAGECSLYTWLCTIARNLWTDRCRRLKKQGEMPEEIESGESVEQRVEDRDLSLHIHRKLHALDEPYREVFTLRVFGQLNFKDIADLFSKTENWARVTFHRAKKMIAEELRKDGIL